MDRADDGPVHIDVVYCPAPGRIDSAMLCLPAGARVSDALAASGVVQRHGLVPAELRVGVWGRVQDLDTILRDRDRVELYRPLSVDPKEARRLRYKRAKKDNAAQ